MSNPETGPPVRRQQLQAAEPEQVTLTLPDVIRHAGDAYNSRDWEKAEQLCRLVLGAQADYFDALNLLGIITAQTGRLEEAAGLLKRAVAVQPDNVAALSNLGGLLKELKRLDEAMVQFDQAIAIKPDFAEAHNNRGIVLQELGQLDDAVASFDQAIGIRPGYAEAYGNRGVALRALKRLDAAVASFDKAIEFKPQFAEAHFNRGNALQDLKQSDAAIASFDKAIGVKPDYAEAHYSRGVALQALNQLDAAIASFDKAIGIKPDYAEAFYERGAALQELNRLDAAVASFDEAIGVRPDYVEAFANRGNALLQLKQLDAAVASYDRAIGIKPRYAEAHNNRGVALQALKQLDAALASYDTAIGINPDYAEACYNRGAALQELKKLDAAIGSYAKAISVKPDYEWLFGTLLHTRMYLCDWRNFASDRDQLNALIEAGKHASPSFPVLSLYDSPALQRQAAELWIQAKHPASHALGAMAKKARRGRIRLGYYSADFRDHPVSHLLAGLFESHDKRRFELIAFSFGPNREDAMRSRVAAAFDRFIDVGGRSDRAVAEVSRELEIDIAIDLGGLTADSHTGIFALRAAPIQVNYLGYPGTMGAGYMDYLIADAMLVPAAHRQHFAEKIARLPSYQPNDDKRAIAGRQFSRSELGLPEQGFVFCCFNHSYKILPNVFDSWMRMLNRVEGSVLWLQEGAPLAESNLRKEAEARGIEGRRLIFARRTPSMADHLARHKAADLFIDTLPYNAHTTASDALWAGLPVLTRLGESFTGRVAASVLTSIGMPELITTSQEEYEARAVELATSREKLQMLRTKLAENRQAAPLFDTASYARHIEAAYLAMYERYQAGLPPDHIDSDWKYVSPVNDKSMQ